MKILPELLEILSCPITEEKFIYDEKKSELISVGGGIAFTIDENGIPILIREGMRKLTAQEIEYYKNNRNTEDVKINNEIDEQNKNNRNTEDVKINNEIDEQNKNNSKTKVA